MFAHIQPSTPDQIMFLMEQYMSDPNPEKVNLGIGLYYDEQGNIPLMHAVKHAEQVLLAQAAPHTYPPIEGSRGYTQLAQSLLFPILTPFDQTRITTLQTLGGSGALKLGADFLKQNFPESQIWVSDPTWANHIPLFQGAGLKINPYPYYDNETGKVRFEAMLDTLNTLPAQSIVLLHPCCHNPTGTDLDQTQWQAVIEVLQKRRLIPFFDIAYQGFGQGLLEDTYAIQLALKTDLNFLVSGSFSKNFSLYGERCGVLSVVTPNEQEARLVLGDLKNIVRRNYSCPPINGSRLVETILSSAELKQQWVNELDAMRVRIQTMRHKLAEGLKKGGAALDTERFIRQQGMFSYTGLNTAQLEALKRDYSIYLVEPGRMCVPGLNERNVDYVIEAILAVTARS